MDPLSIVALIVIILSLFMSAFYSGTETAFTSLNKYKYKVMADDGSKLSKLILWLYEHYETTIIAVLIGNSIFNVALSTLASVLALHFFSAFISDSLISLLTSIAVTLVVYLFGETLPKVIAKRIPDGLARINAIPMAFFVILFYPLTMVFSFFNFLVKAIFRKTSRTSLSKAKSKASSKTMNPTLSRPRSNSRIPPSKRSSPRRAACS